MLFPNISLDTVLRAYNLITKRITRRLYMMLEKPNKDKYLVKCIKGIQFDNKKNYQKIIHDVGKTK